MGYDIKLYKLLCFYMKPKGYWANFDNVILELSVIEKQIGHFPTITEIEKLGYSGLSRAIVKFGGMRFIRDELGKCQVRVETGYWKNIDNIKLWVHDYISTYGIEQFNHRDLHKNGKMDIKLR